jgi:hypothetical protein
MLETYNLNLHRKASQKYTQAKKKDKNFKGQMENIIVCKLYLEKKTIRKGNTNLSS